MRLVGTLFVPVASPEQVHVAGQGQRQPSVVSDSTILTNFNKTIFLVKHMIMATSFVLEKAKRNG